MRGSMTAAQAAFDRRAGTSADTAPGATAAMSATDGAATATPVLDNSILMFRLLAILAAQLFDFATFFVMIRQHGIGAELNPLVATSFQASGFMGLFLVKLALVVLVGSVTVLLGRRRSHVHVPSRLATFITVFAVIGGVFGGWSNFITI